MNVKAVTERNERHGLITHDLIYEMVYLYAKFLELLIHRLGLGGIQCVVLRISECDIWFLT